MVGMRGKGGQGNGTGDGTATRAVAGLFETLCPSWGARVVLPAMQLTTSRPYVLPVPFRLQPRSRRARPLCCPPAALQLCRLEDSLVRTFCLHSTAPTVPPHTAKCAANSP